MAKKSLIIYVSNTGNTEKVAMTFKKTFKKMGWDCDTFKLDANIDPEKLPFDYSKYDFLCMGSPVIHKLASQEFITLLSPPPHREPAAGTPVAVPQGPRHVARIAYGPDSKKGIVFVTFGGLSMGPKEAEPVLSYLNTMMEWRTNFQCVGQFACPGNYPNHVGWYKNLENRPDERDLAKAEIFIEEVIEDYY